MEQSHHSTPVDAIVEDAFGDLHEDVLSTVAWNLADQSDEEETDSIFLFDPHIRSYRAPLGAETNPQQHLRQCFLHRYR